MAKGNNQKQSNDSGLNFEAQLRAAAQAVPAPHCNRRKWWPCASTKSEWFIKDEPQRAEAAGFSLSASIGERVGVRCRNSRVPPEARWHTIKANAKSPEIGKVIADAMGAIERESDVAQASSPAGSGGVPAASRNTGRGRPANPQPGTAALHSKDVLGRVYEYEKFASAFGCLCGEPSEASSTTGTVARRASQFYTPQCVVQMLVAMLAPSEVILSSWLTTEHQI